VRIFLSCAAASCSEDPSIGLCYTLHNDDLPKRIRHQYQVRLQMPNTYRAIVLIWEGFLSQGTPRCCHAGQRHAAKLQTCLGHGSLFMQFPLGFEELLAGQCLWWRRWPG
jgi:hypothetical protein